MTQSSVGVQAKEVAPLANRALLAAAVVPIAVGRWGSYISVPGMPLYICDMILLVAVFATVFGRDSRARFTPALIIVAGYLIAAFALSDMSKQAVQDLAPFVYLAIALICANSFTSREPSKPLKAIRIATAVHLLWYMPVLLGVLAPIASPIGSPAIFSIRGDVDGLVSLLGAGIWWQHARWSRNAVAYMICAAQAACVVIGNSRAPLLVVAILGTVFILAKFGQIMASGTTAATVSIILPLAIIAALVLPNLSLSSGVLGRIGVGGSESAKVSATNTADARLEAWETLLRYQERQSQVMFGAGAGSQYVAESGAVQHLSGNIEVRHSHSWIVSLFTRWGVVGSIVWIIGVVALAFRRQRSGDGASMSTTAAARSVRTFGCAALAVLITSTVGVIMESPFGAIPFYYLVGAYAYYKSHETAPS
jgi:hypothetical protein